MKSLLIRFLKGCAALLITVSVLYAGQALWQKYAVDLPLDKTLKSIEGVETVTWDESNGFDSMNIYVTLKDIANLQKTYAEISKKAENTLKNDEYQIEIKDNRTPELEQAYYEIHYYIQKAVVDGDFPQLEEKAREKAAAAGASMKIFVDAENIYLQMDKNNASLYSVVARSSGRIGGNK